MNPTTIEVDTGEQDQATTPVNPVLKSLRIWRKLQDKTVALTQEYEGAFDEGDPGLKLEEGECRCRI